jgi:hypothetical protein
MVQGCWNNLLVRQVPSLPTLPLYAAAAMGFTGPIALPKSKLNPSFMKNFDTNIATWMIPKSRQMRHIVPDQPAPASRSNLPPVRGWRNNPVALACASPNLGSRSSELRRMHHSEPLDESARRAAAWLCGK